MVRTCRLVVVILSFVSLFAGLSSASTKVPAVTITLTPTVQSPQFVGTSIGWSAAIHNGQQGHIYDYQFAVTLDGQTQVVKDFRTQNSFSWVPSQVEGNYTVTVTVRDITNSDYVVYSPVSVPYVILPWVTSQGGSAVHPTSHPLVALFSGPPCKAGDFLLVRFRQAGSNASSITNSVPCSQKSANFYIAGMLPSTQYLMHWEEVSSTISTHGDDLSFTTGPLQSDYPPTHFQVNVPPTKHDAEFPVVLWHLLPASDAHWPTATDLSGNVIWYYPGQLQTVRMQPGGTMFAFPDNMVFSAYDLAGHEVLQTNVNILNEQLAAKGFRKMDSFNTHEARRLPNGNFLLLGADNLVSTKYQGGTEQNPVCILGDMVLILDHNLQLVWAWDAIDHQDLTRYATQHEICMHGGGGCPAFPDNFTQANDWLHTNSAQLTSDGNILISERHQDWVVKINYQNGKGDGSVIWKMGPYSDFKLLNPPKDTCGDPNVFPWFTHQHDAAFEVEGANLSLGQSVMTVFDDGNLRNTQCGGGQNSRGMVLLVNEKNRTVTALTSGDLGAASGALGSADLLVASDGIFASFGNGALTNPTSARSTELNLGGKIVYELQVDSRSYRIYRRQNLYTPTLP